MTRAGARALTGAVAIAVSAAAPAAADKVVDREQRYRLELPDGYAAAAGTAPDGVLARYAAGDTAVSIARIDFANSAAWSGKAEHFTRVEAGTRAASPGYRRVDRRRHKLGKVPALDLWFERDAEGGRKLVATRFVFFRRYTLILTAAMPAAVSRKDRERVARLVSSFEPQLE